MGKKSTFKNILAVLMTGTMIIQSAVYAGELVDFDDYGASTILTIKAGAVSYQIPFVDAIIIYNEELDCFLINQQKFEDLRV